MVINRFGDVLTAHEGACEMMRLLNERKQNRINREAVEKDLNAFEGMNAEALKPKRHYRKKKGKQL